LAREIVVVVVGFLLTTVLGGLLGALFQRRTWDHQHDAQLFEKEIERAADVCYSLSTLLDRRLYRMVRLRAALTSCTDAVFTREDVEARMRAYDDVLLEWNDALNGNLAVIGTYFGEKARAFLDDEIYPSFAASGACLEQAYRELPEGGAHAQIGDCGLERLNDLVYRIVSYMTSHLRDGSVGRNAAAPIAKRGDP
jgi:hypothetical protein